jgi:dihydroflavonol-4-reductase
VSEEQSKLLKRSLITGATGFVGSAVLRRLHDAGHEVRALARPGSDRRNLADLPAVTVVEGDLSDKESLRSAVQGCEYLFHVAADYRLWIPEPDIIYRINVEGTRDLIEAAVDAGVKKIIYTSSVATLGLNADSTPADEETPVALKDMVGHYKRSKYLAEQEVNRLIRERGAPVVIVNPSTPVGPGDIKPTPTGRIFVDMLRGRMPAYVETGLNIVHVDDVATGHLLALEYGEIGERYILGGENMTLRELLHAIAEAGGVRPPRIGIPHNAVVPVAWLAELWARLTGATPIVTLDEIRMARKFMFFSSGKAAEKLGYKPRAARQAIADAVNWFKENKPEN